MDALKLSLKKENIKVKSGSRMEVPVRVVVPTAQVSKIVSGYVTRLHMTSNQPLTDSTINPRSDTTVYYVHT